MIKFTIRDLLWFMVAIALASMLISERLLNQGFRAQSEQTKATLKMEIADAYRAIYQLESQIESLVERERLENFDKLSSDSHRSGDPPEGR